MILAFNPFGNRTVVDLPGLSGPGRPDPDDVCRAGGAVTDDSPPVLHYRLDADHELNGRYWTAVYDFADQHLRR